MFFYSPMQGRAGRTHDRASLCGDIEARAKLGFRPQEGEEKTADFERGGSNGKRTREPNPGIQT